MADLDAVGAVAERARRAAESRTAEVELSLQIAVGGPVPSGFWGRWGMTVADLASAGAVWLLSSDPGEAVSSLRRLRAISGVSYLTVPGECAHALAPVVHDLSGT